jgi:hypothetical protein
MVLHRCYTIALLLLIAGSACAFQFGWWFEDAAPSPVPQDFIAEWQFDGDTTETKGTYNITATNGSPFFVTDGFKSGVDCVDLNAVNTYYTLGTDCDVTSDFTYSFWSEFDGNYGNYNFLGSGNSNNDNLGPRDIGASIAVQFKVDGSGANVSATNSASMPTAWTHWICGRSNGIGVVYVNGTYKGQNAAVGNGTMTLDVLFGIGNSSYGWNGRCAQLKVYDRWLTATEISDIYTEEKP